MGELAQYAILFGLSVGVFGFALSLWGRTRNPAGTFPPPPAACRAIRSGCAIMRGMPVMRCCFWPAIQRWRSCIRGRSLAAKKG